MNRIAHKNPATLAANVWPAATLAAIVWPASAMAHDGHGMAAAHWHATDSWGLLVFGGMLALAFWLGGRRK